MKKRRFTEEQIAFALRQAETARRASLLPWLGLTLANEVRMLTIRPAEKPENRQNDQRALPSTG